MEDGRGRRGLVVFTNFQLPNYLAEFDSEATPVTITPMALAKPAANVLVDIDLSHHKAIECGRVSTDAICATRRLP